MPEMCGHGRETQHKILEAWRELGLLYRHENDLDDDFDFRIRNVFQRAIVQAYWKALYDYVTGAMGVSRNTLAGCIGVDRTTVYRWNIAHEPRCDANGYAKTEPTLRNFLLTLAAFDIDLVEEAVLPKGSEAALFAYCQAFDHIQHIELGQTDAARITPAEVLCLYFTCRNREWHTANETGHQEGMRRAARHIVLSVQAYAQDSRLTDVQSIERVLYRRQIAWSILESALRHDWF